MTDSIQIHRKKASFILAVSVTSYSVIATYLYNCHQINLMEYTTPIILSIVILTLSCAFSQRFFYRYLIKNNVCIWGIERSGFFNGREKWAKGFENQRV